MSTQENIKPNLSVLLNSFWVHGKGMSGGDQMAIQIFRRIKTSFSSVVLLTNTDGKSAGDRESLQVKYLITPLWFDQLGILPSYILRTFIAIFYLFQVKPKIIYSGSDFFPDVLPAWIYKKFSPGVKWVQCVFHIYSPWQQRPGNKILNWLSIRAQNLSLMIAKNSDGVVVINTEVREKLIQKRYNKDKLELITPGIDFSKIEAVKSENNKKLIYDAIFVGRLNYSKGILDLPLIWRHVIKYCPKARLAIIGGGSDQIKKKLEESIMSNRLTGYIDILGYLQTEQTYRLLKSAKVFVFPSYEEGFGIAIVEALAAKLPIVAWDLSVYDGLFGNAVTKVSKRDIESFAKTTVFYLNQEDYKTQKNDSLNVALKYDWNNVAKKMNNFIFSI